MCESIEEAAYEGNLSELKRIFQSNPESLYSNWDAMEYAIVQNNLSCVKFLLKNGAPCGSFGCAKAAHMGHFLILKFLHLAGCDWDNLTTYCAAKAGHLDCLMYAVRHGCTIDPQAIKLAIEKGHQKCVVFLIKWMTLSGQLVGDELVLYTDMCLKAGLHDAVSHILLSSFDNDYLQLCEQTSEMDISDLSDVTQTMNHFNL